MNLNNFNYLELLPTLLEKIENLEQQLSQINEKVNVKYDLTKRADVRKFLNISESTLCRYMNLNTFRENIHYKIENKGKKNKIIFVESAIIKFKDFKR